MLLLLLLMMMMMMMIIIHISVCFVSFSFFVSFLKIGNEINAMRNEMETMKCKLRLFEMRRSQIAPRPKSLPGLIVHKLSKNPKFQVKTDVDGFTATVC